MSRGKIEFGVVALILVVAITIVVLQQQQAKRMAAGNVALHEEVRRAAILREENAQLITRLKSEADRAEAERRDLARLRGQISRLHQTEQENVQLKIERDRLAKGAQSTAPDTQEPSAQQTPEEKVQRAKGMFGRDLGLALIRAAEANDGNVPNELRGPLFDMIEALSAGAEYDLRAKHFELVYKGSLRDVKDGGETILAREKEPVQRSDGQWVRLYVMADGSSRYIAAGARDGFAAREREFWPGQFKP